MLAPLDDDVLLDRGGLNPAEVARRHRLGLGNPMPERSSRSLGQILRSNLLTLFNFILGGCLVVVLIAGDWRDALFGGVVVVNAVIGVIQEYRAKRTLDRLALLSDPTARVLRGGETQEVKIEEVVFDDLLVLRAGDQIAADARVLRSNNLEVDESLLTGESDPISKSPGDDILSGAGVIAGSAVARVNRSGPESYASRITSQAKRFSLVNSEIRKSINTIILFITVALVPIILIVVNSQMYSQGGWRAALRGENWRDAAVAAVAAVVAMIPQGLVLLTSISFGLAAVALARRNVLVQELPAVEGLARVDVVCLDKTGTLTEGSIVFDEAIVFAEVPGWQRILAWVGADENANATARSLAGRFSEQPGAAVAVIVPFSSARKWSSVCFATSDDPKDPAGGSWTLGAPEVLLDAEEPEQQAVLARNNELAAQGLRVMLLAHSESVSEGEHLVADLQPVALLTFRERVREDAAETLEYFRQQGISLRIISGDNAKTVAAVAREVGFDNAEGFDARRLPDDLDELGEVLDHQHVFGRVGAEQKKSIVLALQRQGHVVAMTGDGVNDALALKTADVGMAMGSGAAVTKAVSRLVLLDGRFSRLPGVVAEGRRVIANIERVANLFLTKTMSAVVLSLVIGVLRWPYPFLPRQLSIVSSLTIGIPAFFLALLPNKRRYRPGFLRRVLMFSIPAGLVVAASIITVYGVAHAMSSTGFSAATELDEARTATTLTVLVLSLWVLSILARPLDRWRGLVVAAMVSLTVLVFLSPASRDFFALAIPRGELLLVVLVVVAVGIVVLEVIYRVLKTRGAISERE